jgi:tetratricopeptide (TPR) repeat protein
MDEETQRLYEQGNRARLDGDYASAQPLLEQAVRRCPDAAECWWALGHVLLNTGEFDRAIARFTKACELEPANVRFLLDLAKTLEMLGEYDQARPYLERIIELAPESREAVEARKNLSYY